MRGRPDPNLTPQAEESNLLDSLERLAKFALELIPPKDQPLPTYTKAGSDIADIVDPIDRTFGCLGWVYGELLRLAWESSHRSPTINTKIDLFKAFNLPRSTGFFYQNIRRKNANFEDCIGRKMTSLAYNAGFDADDDVAPGDEAGEASPDRMAKGKSSSTTKGRSGVRGKRPSKTINGRNFKKEWDKVTDVVDATAKMGRVEDRPKDYPNALAMYRAEVERLGKVRGRITEIIKKFTDRIERLEQAQAAKLKAPAKRAAKKGRAA